MNLTRVLIVWAALVLLGFTVVATLGAPLPTREQRLDAAYHPRTPVTQDVALQSASVIVALQYPDFAGVEPTIDRTMDPNGDQWTVTYDASEAGFINGLIISVEIESGLVEAATYP